MHKYVEAQRADRAIRKTIQENPITAENLQDWQTYLRTVRSTLDLIEANCYGVYRSTALRGVARHDLVLTFGEVGYLRVASTGRTDPEQIRAMLAGVCRVPVTVEVVKPSRFSPPPSTTGTEEA